MSVMAVPEGDLDPEAARIIAMIDDYARRPADVDKTVNCRRVRGLIRIQLAARRALPVGMALLNTCDGPGRLSLRDFRDGVPMKTGTPKTNVDRGKALLAVEAQETP